MQKSFALPKENDLFTEWSAELIARWLIGPDFPNLPIIPLFGTAKDEVTRPYCPRKLTADVRALLAVIGLRVSGVSQRLADTTPVVVVKWVGKLVLQFGGAGKLTDAVMQFIEDNLRAHDLMS